MLFGSRSPLWELTAAFRETIDFVLRETDSLVAHQRHRQAKVCSWVSSPSSSPYLLGLGVLFPAGRLAGIANPRPIGIGSAWRLGVDFGASGLHRTRA